MDKSQATVRPEVIALGTLIETTIERAAVNVSARPGAGMLFLGNRHMVFPVRVVQDSILEPVDKLVWMTIFLQTRASSLHSAFPSYDCIQKTANIGSKSTVARSLAVLRATRWLTLCARIRASSGRFGGNLYVLNDEPLSLVDVLHLDSGYMAFLHRAQQHNHARVQRVARGVLETLDADIRSGVDVCAGHRSVPCDEATVKTFSSDGQGRNLQTLKQPSALSDIATDVSQHPESSQPSRPKKKNDAIMEDEEVALIYPKRLDKNQWALTNRYLASVLPEQRQPILDELDGRLRSVEKGMRPLYDEMSFLNSLCKATRKGEFKLKLGAPVQAEREAREKVRTRGRQSRAGALNSDPRDLRVQLETGVGALTRIRQSLGQPCRTVSRRPDKD
ncbi:MAG: helix-turn-helix domain-containing protein [Gammaproteobacteria bacterium]|nr:helix-turn-helix domain-containing protein [Gammaproteobacteria bacterium]